MDTLLTGLNPDQRKAVTTIKGPVLALAGPGSGKTRALTNRIAYLLQGDDVAPWNIVAVTFTNKAAREMKNRLSETLTPKQVNALMVGTFHSLCARWLRQDVEALGAYDSNFVIYDTNDQQAVVKRAIQNLDLDNKRWKPRPIHYAISKAKNEMVTPETFQAISYQEEITLRVYERYQEIMVENNAFDFDDLLLVTRRLFRLYPDILKRYQQQFKHVMVDEFQDTNMVQYELANMLAGEYRNIFVVGDLDQGVYSWRGADYRNVLRFRDDYPDHKLIRLSQNYRSTEMILNAAKQVISKNKHRIENQLFTERGQGIKIRVVEAYDEKEEANFILDEINNLEVDGTYDPGQIAIMYRTNAQSRALEESFVARSMPYLLVRGTRFYERKEVKDAIAYLRLIHNPEDSVSLRRIINVPARAIGAKTIKDLEKWAFQLKITPWKAIQQLLLMADDTDYKPAVPAPFKSRAYKSLIKFGQLMSMLIQAKHKLNLSELYELMVARTGYKGFVKDNSPEGEDRWENLVELQKVTDRFINLTGAEALAQFLEDVALVSDVDALGEEGMAPALLTLHTAKGLEFPVVFIVGMEEGLCPHSRSFSDREQMEEERRLIYVGITRAKDRLYLTRAFRRSNYGYEELTARSRFLDDISPELLDTRKNKNSHPSIRRNKVVNPTVIRSASIVPSNHKSPVATAVTSQYIAGETVYHSKFGEGTIIAVELDGNDQFVQVAFPNQGIKKLSAKFAHLEKR